ncbi:helix-turn-helix domain-containing protein [Sulfurovum sp.]|uniref:helix-turn-helix domain-containing protein n=1 Tax=Sulfurovum sp. TaxID=1969726 RepID=UPI0025FA6BB0|nr:helix-turn-helix domain-containing protein [Sulfurovum sp.]
MSRKLPLFSIEQTINTYKYLFEPNPVFGMDFFADDFEAKDIVLLDDVKAGSQGIPIHFGYYALFLRIHGETKRTINQFEYIIKPQSLQLVNPGAIYSFKDITNASRTFVLLFNRSFIEEESLSEPIQSKLLDFHQRCQEDIVLENTQYAHAVSLYEQLSTELRTKNDDYKLMAKMLINQLLVLLKREKVHCGRKQNATRAEQICAEFLVLIEEHYWKKRSVKEYAELLGISPKHLSETVKNTLHHSALSYIHTRIIKEIQYLLCFGGMSIKQIAYALHFDTVSQLGRFFKRHEGVSPKAYRLKHKDIALYDRQNASK